MENLLPFARGRFLAKIIERQVAVTHLATDCGCSDREYRRRGGVVDNDRHRVVGRDLRWYRHIQSTGTDCRRVAAGVEEILLFATGDVEHELLGGRAVGTHH